MNKKQLRGLEASILHWDRVCQGIEASNGAEGCPLCRLYLVNECIGCPIREHYGKFCGIGDKDSIKAFPFREYEKNHSLSCTIPMQWTKRQKKVYFKGIENAEGVLLGLLRILPIDHKWRTMI